MTVSPARQPQPASDTAPVSGAAAKVLPLSVVERTGAERSGPRGAKPGRARLWLLLAALLLVIVGSAVFFQPKALQEAMNSFRAEPAVETTDTAPATAGASPQPGIVAGLGRLVPAGDIRVIAPPFGAGDARIASLLVEEGSHVAAGDVIAVMDSQKPLEAAVSSAKAAVGAKEAVSRQARDAATANRDEARAALARAETAAANSGTELARAEKLARSGTVSGSTLDTKRAAHDQALQDVAKAKASLSRYAYDDISEQADVLVAEKGVEAAKADLARAEAELDQAFVRAPISGTILTVHVRPGEKPGAAGIVSLGNIDQMTAEIEIYQSLIGRVKVGAPVTITADALAAPLQGTVTRLGLEVARQTATDASPAANTDARVVTVHVRLAPESAAAARPYTNLQVTARIEVLTP